ncbi:MULTISPECIES: phage tail protein [Kordiimonas]|mgnify:CR=1 FL=1|jgi:microcystin-dependent protein|uniref:phage tail protein n=1 Tax=Kordiimonas TaxID=288021 RepID=UPI002580AE23|nr:tail fiber protein [Kordiimonas sp. UBA4487]
MITLSSKIHRARLGGLMLGLSALGVSGAAEASCSPDSYTGSVCLTAASFCPSGTLEADGSSMLVSQNTALFAIIGNAYGGDGHTNFNLPDLRGRVPVGIGTGRDLSPVSLGTQRGTETVMQSVANLAPHNHEATFTPTHSATAIEAGEGTAATGHQGKQPNNVDSSEEAVITPTRHRHGGAPTGGTVSIGDTGNGSPMPVLDPGLGMRFCIVTSGKFPPRD